MTRWSATVAFLGLLTVSGLDVRQAQASSDLNVAATIAPVHSLVAMVTGGLAEPALIVRPGASPHNYALKPSEAAALSDADLVFWVGEGLEPWMAKAVTTLAAEATVVELGLADGLTRLPVRKGGVWGDHDHGHDHAAHDEHDHHDDGYQESGGTDMHLWLDPENALVWLTVIAERLAEADPDNAEAFEANAARAAERLATVGSEIADLLAPIDGAPYVVFHDAYQYFENRFGLRPVGAVSLGDADRPGPKRIVELREAIADSGAVCIFAEPQFEPRLVQTVIEGSDVKGGMLDPIGAGQQPGAGLYPAMMLDLAESLRDCLG